MKIAHYTCEAWAVAEYTKATCTNCGRSISAQHSASDDSHWLHTASDEQECLLALAADLGEQSHVPAFAARDAKSAEQRAMFARMDAERKARTGTKSGRPWTWDQGETS